MTLFKTADEELDDEESNVENRLREFTLEDPDEFLDPESEEDTALTGDKRKQYGCAHSCRMKQTNIGSSGMARAQRDRGNGLGDHRLLLESEGLTYGGRSCSATSLLATVTLLYDTLPPIQRIPLHLPPLARHKHKQCPSQDLDESDGRRLQRKTLTPQTGRSSG